MNEGAVSERSSAWPERLSDAAQLDMESLLREAQWQNSLASCALRIELSLPVAVSLAQPRAMRVRLPCASLNSSLRYGLREDDELRFEGFPFCLQISVDSEMLRSLAPEMRLLDWHLDVVLSTATFGGLPFNLHIGEPQGGTPVSAFHSSGPAGGPCRTGRCIIDGRYGFWAIGWLRQSSIDVLRRELPSGRIDAAVALRRNDRPGVSLGHCVVGLKHDCKGIYAYGANVVPVGTQSFVGVRHEVSAYA